MPSITSILDCIVQHYEATRQVGHTSVAVPPVQEGRAMMVAANRDAAKTISKNHSIPMKMFLTLHGTDSWRGRILPLIWDNYAVQTLARMALDEISKLNEKIYNLRNELDKARKSASTRSLEGERLLRQVLDYWAAPQTDMPDPDLFDEILRFVDKGGREWKCPWVEKHGLSVYEPWSGDKIELGDLMWSELRGLLRVGDRLLKLSEGTPRDVSGLKKAMRQAERELDKRSKKTTAALRRLGLDG